MTPLPVQETNTVIECLKCAAPMKPGSAVGPVSLHCPKCGTDQETFLYPAFFKPEPQGKSALPLAAETEAGCYYHPRKKAVVPCAVCGRFLCALCDIHIDDRHVCPACMESEKTGRQTKKFENHRVLYDKIALLLALIPFTFIFWFMAVITAPAALFVAIRYWRTPCSLVFPARLRFIVAIILAGGQILLLSFGIYGLFSIGG